MIHKFYLNDKYIVMDINSGSVHVIDKLIFDILDYYETHDLNEIMKILKKEYIEETIKEGYDEIAYLEKEGLLFTPQSEINFKYNEDNIIKALCLHVAHDCNLKCKYCFASQGNFKGENSLMKLDTGKKALEFLASNSGNRKNLEVDFFGGEPLMNFSLVKDLVKYGREIEKEYDKNFRFTITTNGLLLDEDNMEFINENMDNIVLSLDGRKEVNDNMRKTINDGSSYDVIVPKFKEMVRKRGNKDYYIRGTFTSENLDFSKDIKHFYDEGFKKVSVEPVVTDESISYALREEHLDRILGEYEEFSKEYIKIKKSDPDFHFFHFMIDLTQGPCVIKRSVGCGAGSEYIAVTPEGDLYPCHQFVGEEEFLLGNLEDGIINKKVRDKFKNSNIYTKEECNSCWARFYCSGGCHANNHYGNNDLMKPYNIACEMEKKRMECAISILASLSE